MFAKIQDGIVVKYPYTFDDLKFDNPNVSFGQSLSQEVLDAYGLVTVGYEAAPSFDARTHKIEVSTTPVLVDGTWIATKTVVAKTQQQLDSELAAQSKSIRAQRDQKLAETDWRYRRDQTTTQEWDDYCQALRDVPSQSGFPWDVQWPNPPQ